jgi:hypothetical protein
MTTRPPVMPANSRSWDFPETARGDDGLERLPQSNERRVGKSFELGLTKRFRSDPSRDEQDKNNEQKKPDPAARIVAPAAAMRPSRQHSDQHEDQDNQQNGPEGHRRTYH